MHFPCAAGKTVAPFSSFGQELLAALSKQCPGSSSISISVSWYLCYVILKAWPTFAKTHSAMTNALHILQRALHPSSSHGT